MLAGALVLGVDASTNQLALTLLLVGALVVVPLALPLAEPAAARTARRGRFAVARRLHLGAGALLTVSCVLSPGVTAGLLSLPWLAFTVLIAFFATLRFGARGGGPAGEVAIDAALLFLAIGGVWTAASRFGLPLLGFAEPWLLLTAVHFHFAGLVLPLVTGICARASPGWLATVASAGVMLGVPLVAAGITAGAHGMRTFECLAATWLSGAALLSAVLLGRAARRAGRTMPAVLLAVAAAALTIGMTLALVYAITMHQGAPRLAIADMVATHGVINVFGFALPALVALRSVAEPEPAASMEVLLPLLRDEPMAGLWEAREPSAPLAAGDARVFTDRHELELPGEPPGAPLPAGPFRAAAAAALTYRSFEQVLHSLRATPEATVHVGETIRARYHLLPGIDIVFASRVTAVFDAADAQQHRAGFTYQTLVGHPEHGEETFEVRKDLASGRVFATISARSKPTTALCGCLLPLVRRWQLRAGRAGVAKLRAYAEAARLGVV